MRYTRPTPREVFLNKEKQLSVFFYTSNLPKFLQARFVFARSGLVLQHFRSKTDPYNEDYSVGKEVLLERAIQEIVSSVGASSLFFVEDTSLRLESLFMEALKVSLQIHRQVSRRTLNIRG
jgi:hypothetical protein